MANVFNMILIVFATTACNAAFALDDIDLWPYFMNRDGINVNKTKLFLMASKFYLVPPICLNTNLTTSENSSEPVISRPCNCMEMCKRPTCCLDHPYSAVPYRCVNVLVYPKGVNFKSEYQMVSSCELRGTDYAEMCNINTNTSLTFDDPIVTSIRSGKTYKNKYCAFCHLEQENDLVSWVFNLYCVKDLTKLALTSSDIMSLLTSNIRNGTCLIAYFPGSLIYYVEKCLFDVSISIPEQIQTCNVSGLLITYDTDLYWACEHFDLPYHGFKNVFCYICNPSIVSERTDYYIDQCNITGLWQNFDSDILEGCKSVPSEPRWRPFKNLYCFFCNVYDVNMDPTELHLMPLYSNTNISVSEWYESDGKQFTTLIRIYNVSTNEYFFNEVVKKRYANICRDRLSCPQTTQSANKDADYCVSCSCSPACPMQMSCCRRYIAGEETYMCISDKLHYNTSSSSENVYLAISTCPFRTDGVLRKKCEDPNTEDILQVIPVLASDEVIFRNVYCAQCNDIFQSKPLDLIVQCNMYVDAALFPRLQEFLEVALEANCELKYLPSAACNKTQNYISKCNTTGMWGTYNMRIQSACEAKEEIMMPSIELSQYSFLEYMHLYCYVCKTKEPKPLYNNCIVTKHWNTYNNSVTNLCKDVYGDVVWGPFKNVYCLICNIPETIETVYEDLDMIKENIFQPSYRMIFQVLPTFFEIYNQDKITMFSSEEAMPRQKILCSEGKVFINNSCDYPIQAALSQMEYGIYFRAEIIGLSSIILYNISTIADTILIPMLSFEFDKYDSVLKSYNFYLWTSLPCNTSLWAKDTHFYAFVSMKIIKTTGSFKLLEEHFAKEMEGKFVLDDIEFIVKLVPDYKMLYLLENVTSLSETGCYVQRESFKHNDAGNLKVFSDILTCTQREIRCGFVLDSYHNVYIPIINTTLNKYQFEFINQTLIKICTHLFDEIQNITNSIPESKLDIWSRLKETYTIFSFSCTCLSILCLLVTLVTYLIHSELRTRPGKLNISLVVSLLLAQSSLQFGLNQTDYKYVCIFMGIFIHFFWMLTFVCFNICTWNIYITFSSNLATMNQLSMSRDVPINYILYMCGIPLVIVIITVVFHVGWSHSEYVGYGGRICFLSDNLTSIVAFIAPVLLICIANIVLYSLTFRSLRKNPGMRTNQAKRSEFFIFLRLFFITGISWILQVVDAVYVLTPLSYIVTFVNALEGVFILLAFVCNKRVLQLFKIRLYKPTFVTDALTPADM
ncbi:hypothetical protein ACJMK2_017679 [Sinanodonta woodiana]|uniref:G-protein coupled receptors family 2 profile 2 domain-containing protein n=1 Tax=Sinanodonta woodiana TaxID=1069815 RepID=A0ABD3UDT0_SINWO